MRLGGMVVVAVKVVASHVVCFGGIIKSCRYDHVYFGLRHSYYIIMDLFPVHLVDSNLTTCFIQHYHGAG